ncbi:MAG: HAMP domain-containing protein, partial [Anaerolineaceae bacterium]|nr:HAMP domain-containing protein [Anaerolineaceae bacterium]
MRLRLIVSLTLVSLVAILAMVVVIRQEARGRVQTYLYRGGMFGADRLVTALETYHQSTGNWESIGSRMEELQTAPGMRMMRGMTARGLRAYRLYDAVGALVWDGAGAQQGGSSLTPAERDRSIRLRSTDGETIGFLVVEGAPALLPQADEEGLVNILNEAAVRAGMISGVAAVLVALVLGAGLLRPIRQMTAAAKKIASGDLSQRVPVQGDDELASLAQSFNTMTEALQRSEERRRRMTADIAHELRTPLAVQRAHLEALQDGIYDLNPQNMQPILEQTELLSRLVDDLRTLALVDSGEL